MRLAHVVCVALAGGAGLAGCAPLHVVSAGLGFASAALKLDVELLKAWEERHPVEHRPPAGR